jgi:two-component system cell cycle response regulator DivK
MSKILVVDDNPMNLRLTSEILELAGHEILLAANGKEAVEIAARELPDMILMDLRMPVMDGNEAMKHIKADLRMRHIPVIALTASAMKGEREKLLAAGFNGYVDKPIDVYTFSDTISAHLPPAASMM